MADSASTTGQPPPSKKIRSCSSSESTPPTPNNPNLSLDETTTSASLLDAVRRYDAEATKRVHEAQSELASAKEDVLSAMESLKRAHERLGRMEALAAESAISAKAAREYRMKWETQLIGKKEDGGGSGSAIGGGGIGVGSGAALLLSAAENDEDARRVVSFAFPQHHHLKTQSHATLYDTSHTSEETGLSSSGLLGHLPHHSQQLQHHQHQHQHRHTPNSIRRKRIRVSEHGWGTYEGQLDALGEPHGRGSITWENGGKYDGQWVDGKANGLGVMHYGNGDKYEGGWKDGCRCGQGTHHFKDGGVYEGQWCNAAPDGIGKMTLKNGSHYEGAWKDGKWHGHGIVRPVNGGEWEGTFLMGKCTLGTLRRPNGELEIGRYDSVNPDDVKEGVWWSVDRETMWIVEDGQKKVQIDFDTAMEIVAKIGVPLPEELQQQRVVVLAAQSQPSAPPILPNAAAAWLPLKSEE